MWTYTETVRILCMQNRKQSYRSVVQVAWPLRIDNGGLFA